MVNIGRRDAFTRISHILCEMLVRLRAIGLADKDNSCAFPISQNMLGDAQGLSGVHVNRVLQEIRAAKLITLNRGVLKILDWEGLAQAGQFDPNYLHLENQPRAA